MTASAIYEGRVIHARRREVENTFAYPVWMLWLDLAEAEAGLSVAPLFSTLRGAPLSWRRSDHLGAPRRPLADCARDLVEEETGTRPAGAVRLLTFPRTLGLAYSPVSFYYLYGDGGLLEAAIAEVTSTPWRERRHYVATHGDRGGPLRQSFRKAMHVSPFMPMEQTYDWSPGVPGDALRVRLSNWEQGRVVFSASLALRRRPLSRAALARLLLTRPPQPHVALARIYLQALRLRRRGAPYHRRPSDEDRSALGVPAPDWTPDRTRVSPGLAGASVGPRTQTDQGR
jgi:uncharacterized protein